MDESSLVWNLCLGLNLPVEDTCRTNHSCLDSQYSKCLIIWVSNELTAKKKLDILEAWFASERLE